MCRGFFVYYWLNNYYIWLCDQHAYNDCGEQTYVGLAHWTAFVVVRDLKSFY